MKLQTVRHADGSLEIQRKLSLDWLENCQDGDPLLYESSIVWLEDIATLPYVREMTVPKCKSRRGPLRQGSGGRIVGYSTLHADAPADRSKDTFTRRVFYLKDTDSHASQTARASTLSATPTADCVWRSTSGPTRFRTTVRPAS